MGAQRLLQARLPLPPAAGSGGCLGRELGRPSSAPLDPGPDSPLRSRREGPHVRLPGLARRMAGERHQAPGARGQRLGPLHPCPATAQAHVPCCLRTLRRCGVGPRPLPRPQWELLARLAEAQEEVPGRAEVRPPPGGQVPRGAESRPQASAPGGWAAWCVRSWDSCVLPRAAPPARGASTALQAPCQTQHRLAVAPRAPGQASDAPGSGWSLQGSRWPSCPSLRL